MNIISRLWTKFRISLKMYNYKKAYGEQNSDSYSTMPLLNKKTYSIVQWC